MSLLIDLRETDVLRIGESKIKLVHKSGRLVRLDVDAPPGVLVEHTKSLTKDHVINDYIRAEQEHGR